MKYTIIALGLVFSLSSFAAKIKGIEVTGLPTATETFSKRVWDSREVSDAREEVIASCLEAREKAEKFVVKNGFRILSSTGCESVLVENNNSEMSYSGIDVSTKYEIIFR